MQKKKRKRNINFDNKKVLLETSRKINSRSEVKILFSSSILMLVSDLFFPLDL